jgi:hypothetical protein
MSRADADREIFKRMQEIALLFGIEMSRKSLQTWRRAARQAFGQDDKPRNMFGCFVWAMKQYSSDENFRTYTVTEKIEFLLAPVSGEHVQHLRGPPALARVAHPPADNPASGCVQPNK